MSEQKPAHVTASVNTGMSVGESQRPGRARFQAKLLGMILAVVILLSAVAWYVFVRPGSSQPNTTANNSVKAPPANTSADQKAQFYADEGQYAQAEQSWQDQLDSAKDTDTKLGIYYQQSALALKFKHYDDAKKYADAAKQLAPNSPQPYVALAQLAEAQNNIPQAKQYWQQAINHVDTNMPGYNLTQSDYQSHLDALK